MAQQDVRHQTLIKTEAEWRVSQLALLPGELGYASDTRVVKVGTDGQTLWNDLPILNVGFQYDSEHKRLILS